VSQAGPDAAQLAELVARVSGSLAPGGAGAAAWTAKVAAQPLWLKLSAVLVTAGGMMGTALYAAHNRSPAKTEGELARATWSTPVQAEHAEILRAHGSARFDARAQIEGRGSARQKNNEKGPLEQTEVEALPDSARAHEPSTAPPALAAAPYPAAHALLEHAPAPTARKASRARSVRAQTTTRLRSSRLPSVVPAPAPVAPTTPEAESPESQPAGASVPENEQTLISQAQRTLGARPARAIELLDRHETLYPDGQFAEEREVLWIDALSQLGMSKALSARGQRFLAAYPLSLHRARVKALLDAARSAP
jgi:hypothetical protein